MRRFFGFLALVFVVSVLTLRVNSYNPFRTWFAETSKRKTDPDSALVETKPKRIDVPLDMDAPDGVILLEDHFTDNRHQWDETSDREIRKSVRNGKYRMENMSSGTAYWSDITIPFKDEDDFMIEAAFTKIAGQTQNTFGLAWGIDKDENFHAFGITDDGDYAIYRSTQTWEKLVPYTASSSIEKPEKTNILRIEKVGFKLKFYINNHLVNTLSHQALFGKGVGFYVNNDIMIEVDDFVVKKL